MAPWQGSGNVIRDVTFERTVYEPAPEHFEAGTGSIADAVGLGAALDYVQRIGPQNIERQRGAHGAFVPEALVNQTLLASLTYYRDPDGQVNEEDQTGLPGPATTTYTYTPLNQLATAGVEGALAGAGAGAGAFGATEEGECYPIGSAYSFRTTRTRSIAGTSSTPADAGGELTWAGRSVTKHLDLFPGASGPPADYNAIGHQALEEILATAREEQVTSGGFVGGQRFVARMGSGLHSIRRATFRYGCSSRRGMVNPRICS